ncbi:hypothetical protein [Mitsuokella sp. oral taxon 131]|uniref:hypothetical protein n=1 Tax=Mitsuokella sp. oral taxon 131 TaxID=1321780 RepID=UPI0003AD9C4D|nr:hypothetical protein [Mitsuokella sp. oral taxon 131]ERL03195.1 hypothetical protein HMPREF1985_02357 [Mitsuokella sp. oral taxon 131 str. W9106]
MIQSIILMCVCMICYFAIRVNRVEMRMNALEKILREVAKEKDIDTEMLGKPFGGATGLWDVLKAAWKGK